MTDDWCLNNAEFLSFDCYGTLIDWESGILNALRPILGRHGVAATNKRILECYAELEAEAEAGPYKPYREILGAVVDGFGRRFEFEPTEADRRSISKSVADWPAFNDSVEALARLATRFKLVVLSNIDDDLFVGSEVRLGSPFHRVLTAQQIGSYKPSLSNFRFAIDALGGDPTRIVHVAQSLYHDIAPANRLGLSTVWIDRRLGQEGSGATPPAEAKPTLEFPSMAALADYAVG